MNSITNKKAFVLYNMGYGGTERVFRTLSENIPHEKAIFLIHKKVGNKEIKILPLPNVYFYSKLSELSKLLKDYNVIYFSYLISFFGHFRIFNQKHSSVSIIRHATFYNSRLYPFVRNDNLFKDIVLFIVYNLARLSINNRSLHIALNQSMKKNIITIFKIDESKVFVIANPIPNIFFEQLKLHNPDRFSLLFVGRLIRMKGIYDLMDIVEDLDSNIDVVIVGDGILNHEVQKWINKNSELRKIDHILSTDNISYYYAKANVTVSTSYEEGSPNVLLESLAVGTPVIAYDCNVGPSDIIVQGINGFLVPLGDKSTFVKRVEESTTKKWDIDEIKSSVIEHRTDIIINKYLSLLEEKI